MPASLQTQNHAVIRRWAERRNGKPALILKKMSEPQKALCIKFDNDRRDAVVISWDDFFQIFDEHNLRFVYEKESMSIFAYLKRWIKEDMGINLPALKFSWKEFYSKGLHRTVAVASAFISTKKLCLFYLTLFFQRLYLVAHSGIKSLIPSVSQFKNQLTNFWSLCEKNIYQWWNAACITYKHTIGQASKVNIQRDLYRNRKRFLVRARVLTEHFRSVLTTNVRSISQQLTRLHKVRF